MEKENEIHIKSEQKIIVNTRGTNTSTPKVKETQDGSKQYFLEVSSHTTAEINNSLQQDESNRSQHSERKMEETTYSQKTTSDNTSSNFREGKKKATSQRKIQQQSGRGFTRRTSLADLEALFHCPLGEASRILGVSTTMIKRLCRKYGIKRWPYRQLRSINKSIDQLKTMANTTFYEDRLRLNQQILLLNRKKHLVAQEASGRLNLNELFFLPNDWEFDSVMPYLEEALQDSDGPQSQHPNGYGGQYQGNSNYNQPPMGHSQDLPPVNHHKDHMYAPPVMENRYPYPQSCQPPQMHEPPCNFCHGGSQCDQHWTRGENKNGWSAVGSDNCGPPSSNAMLQDSQDDYHPQQEELRRDMMMGSQSFHPNHPESSQCNWHQSNPPNCQGCTSSYPQDRKEQAKQQEQQHQQLQWDLAKQEQHTRTDSVRHNNGSHFERNQCKPDKAMVAAHPPASNDDAFGEYNWEDDPSETPITISGEVDVDSSISLFGDDDISLNFENNYSDHNNIMESDEPLVENTQQQHTIETKGDLCFFEQPKVNSSSGNTLESESGQQCEISQMYKNQPRDCFQKPKVKTEPISAQNGGKERQDSCENDLDFYCV